MFKKKHFFFWITILEYFLIIFKIGNIRDVGNVSHEKINLELWKSNHFSKIGKIIDSKKKMILQKRKD